MNKKLIITYFEEFKYWLNGGKILSKNTLLAEWSDTQSEDIWRIPDEDISKVLIVIDDEYIDYRKALIEGKTVQYNFGNYEINKKDFPDTWRDLDPSIGILSRAHPENYRIKPDVPKFKVGDWVVHNGVVKQVTKAVDGLIDSLDNQVAVIMKEESLELWEPEDGKYFWYKNDLVRFHETQTNLGLLLESARGCSYYPAEKNFEDFCEPYLGKLPYNLKQDSKNI